MPVPSRVGQDEEMRSGRAKDSRTPCHLLCAAVGVEQGPALQQDAGEFEQAVGGARQGAPAAMTARPRGRVAAAAFGSFCTMTRGWWNATKRKRIRAVWRMATTRVLPPRAVAGVMPGRN